MWERGETSSVYAMQRAVVRTTRDYHAYFGLSPAPALAGSPRARSICRTAPLTWLVCHEMILLNRPLRAVRRIKVQHSTRQIIPPHRTISLFSLFKKAPAKPESQPTLSQDNLFHPFSRSPFPAVVARGEAIKSLAPCPVCASHHHHIHDHVKAQPREVAFECPDCGWPTHCSEEHWRADQEHAKYCSRLREVNEDEHDLRSGRRLREFELPGTLPLLPIAQLRNLPSVSVGPQDTEAAISFSNWDVFWYTRNFPSMDTERSQRHASKLLTYPITIGSVLHQYSALTLGNQRLTPEGSRSLAGTFTSHIPVNHL